MGYMVSNKQRESGFLTEEEFNRCRNDLSGILIAPFDPNKARGIGYNLALSELVYSITRNKMLTIIRGNKETYVKLKPQETVLALSYEYVKTPSNIAGTFHSRVRLNAQGLGSTSTTLDPDWKGLLLLCFNNPTKKNIKLVLSTMDEGVEEKASVVTLVAGYTANALKMSDENYTLHLDNPAMRTDIWLELTEKPHRLINNNNYQKFKEIVSHIAKFKMVENTQTQQIKEVERYLLDLEIAIYADCDEKKIKRILLELKNMHDLEFSMKKQIKNLMIANDNTGCSTDITEQLEIVEVCRKNEYRQKLELARRECQYQILCEEIRQIHTYIRLQVPSIWEKGIISEFVHGFVKKNSVGILTSIIFVFVVVFGLVQTTKQWQEIVFMVIPTLVSVGINFIKGVLEKMQ